MKRCEYQFEAYAAGKKGEGRDVLLCKCAACMKSYEDGRKEHLRDVQKDVAK